MAKKKTDRTDDVILPPDDNPVKEDLVEYFGADGKDEGQKLMQNPDGTWGDEGAAG